MSKSIKVIITANFGSDMQAEIHKATLELMLRAWQMNLDAKHKKNTSKVQFLKEGE